MSSISIRVSSIGIGVSSITGIEKGGVSLSIVFSLTLANVVDSGEGSIAISTGDRDIGSIHTGGRLAIGIGTIAVSSIENSWVSLSGSIGSSNQSRSKDKGFHVEYGTALILLIQLIPM